MNHKERVDWILNITAQINPYQRQEANRKSEFYIYNMGYLASYLASKMQEDPFIAREFFQHAQEQSKQRLR